MGAEKNDAEDLKLELDKMDELQQGKDSTIDQAKVEADIAALKELAGAGKRQEAVEGLLALEKAGRVAEDIGSTRKACSAILEVGGWMGGGWGYGAHDCLVAAWSNRHARAPARGGPANR